MKRSFWNVKRNVSKVFVPRNRYETYSLEFTDFLANFQADDFVLVHRRRKSDVMLYNLHESF